MKNCVKNKFKLSSNVLEEIHQYAAKNDEKPCPILFLQVKEVERDKGRYWLILEDNDGKEIWAMFSVLLTQQILIQQLVIKPIIKLKHYYLHKFEAANFFDNPLETYINVIGINEIEIFDKKAFKGPLKEMTLQPNVKKLGMLPARKKRKRRPEPELESTDESDNDSELRGENEITLRKAKPKTKLNCVVTVKETILPIKNTNQNINQVYTDERNGQPRVKSAVRPSENKIPNQKRDESKPRSIVKPSENKILDGSSGQSKAKSSNQQSGNEILNGINDQSKAGSTIQPSENNISGVINDTSQIKTIVQPSENKSPNIQTSDIVPEVFAGSGRTAVPITSLTLTKNSPLIRGSIKTYGAVIISARGCSYRRCRLKDSSGEISCVIFEPICTNINNFIKVGAIIEIEQATVEEILGSLLSSSEKFKLNCRPVSKVKLYNDNLCVYEHPPKANPVPQRQVQPMINHKTKYKRLQHIKNFVRAGDRVDAIGVMVWMSRLIDVTSNNRRIKCRNIRIEDESGSALVSIWENAAECWNYPLESIVSAKYARLKMNRDDIELIIDANSTISIAEDCEEKTRLKKWYQPAARRMIPKI